MTTTPLEDLDKILNYCRTNYGSHGISDEYEEELTSRIEALISSEKKKLLDRVEKEVLPPTTSWNANGYRTRAVEKLNELRTEQRTILDKIRGEL